MTTLPSFVELMASLGLEQNNRTSTPSISSTPSSPRTTSLFPSSPARCSSSLSLRDCTLHKTRNSRYSPYMSALSHSRRGSLSSSSSSSSESELTTLTNHHTRPISLLHRRKSPNSNLTVDTFGSTTDLAASTPISVYVRRKTPGASPTSPTSRDYTQDVESFITVPVSIPSLPPFLQTTTEVESPPLLLKDLTAFHGSNISSPPTSPPASRTSSGDGRSRPRKEARLSPAQISDFSGHMQTRCMVHIN
ncbi:hypothetical protein AMATHDRAFT_1917 [Amanita thiersii Skay4041]|uniref:Uncharacterized protein n=1 Tax=Amanita thiersii Skay4041 TaxID=703135 RepID=A0A2A9NQQ4_9AGAR|nr:hypothetical protein AMATHDRAFT_1917 [Amanita thiersii Skay4041]